MTLTEWIDAKFDGSVKNAAIFLGLNHRTVYSYYRYERWPRPQVCQKIINLTEVDLERWQKSFYEKSIEKLN